MPYTIDGVKFVGESSTLDINDILPAPSPCTSPAYTAGADNMAGVIINSVVGSIVTYTPTRAGSFVFGVTILCNEETFSIENVEGVAIVFQATVSLASEPYTFLPCCNDCFNPIIVSNLYEGDTYIPFSLEMEDGVVVSTLSGDVGSVLNGVGVIELSTPLVAGANIQLQVDSDTCKAVSSVMKVKAISEDCDTCANPNNCHIRLLNVSVKSDGVNLVSISKLNVEAFSELRYRLDNGAWFSDWSSIGSFNSLVNHTLGIKLVNNPSCRIEYPFLAISYI
jgi:hypothetical protein